jgi:hypothetical protein
MSSFYPEHIIVPYSFARMSLKAERQRDDSMSNATSTKGVLCRYPSVVDGL